MKNAQKNVNAVGYLVNQVAASNMNPKNWKCLVDDSSAFIFWRRGTGERQKREFGALICRKTSSRKCRTRMESPSCASARGAWREQCRCWSCSRRGNRRTPAGRLYQCLNVFQPSLAIDSGRLVQCPEENVHRKIKETIGHRYWYSRCTNLFIQTGRNVFFVLFGIRIVCGVFSVFVFF